MNLKHKSVILCVVLVAIQSNTVLKALASLRINSVRIRHELSGVMIDEGAVIDSVSDFVDETFNFNRSDSFPIATDNLTIRQLTCPPPTI